MADTPGGKVKPGGFLGSLKDALAAASRDEPALAANRAVPGSPASAPGSPASNVPAVMNQDPPAGPPPVPQRPDNSPVASPSSPDAGQPKPQHPPKPMSAAEAAREARGVTSLKPQDKHMEFDGTNTTRIIRGGAPRAQEPAAVEDSQARTQLVRGRQALKRGQFAQDPVVGWLVITGGPGLGSYRPVFEGNNSIGRAPTSRIPLDFGDDTISFEEQAYLRYDGNDRGFLFVPNMSKTNVVSVNNKRPTTAIELAAMDVIVMGRTQLVFMPFCGPEFDWSEISESKD